MFVIEQDIYCYKVMLFELKNTEAIYQCLINKMLFEYLGKRMEVYIDDMLIKSLYATDHILHLEWAFNVLDSYKMKLNP